MMLRVDRDLHVVADDPEPRPLVPSSGVGIGQRYLLVRRGEHLRLESRELRCISSLSLASFSFRRLVLVCERLGRLLPVGRVELAADSARRSPRAAPAVAPSCARVKFLSRLFTALNLLPSIATLAFREQTHLAAQRDEAGAHLADGSPLSLRKSAMVL